MQKITKEEVRCECGSVKQRAKYDLFCDQCEVQLDEEDYIDASYVVEDGETHDTDTKNWTNLAFCCTECYRDWMLKFKDNLPENLSCFYVAMSHLQTKEEFERFIGTFRE